MKRRLPHKTAVTPSLVCLSALFIPRLTGCCPSAVHRNHTMNTAQQVLHLCNPGPVQPRLLLLLPSLLGAVLQGVQGCHAINLLPFQQQMHLVQSGQM